MIADLGPQEAGARRTSRIASRFLRWRYVLLLLLGLGSAARLHAADPFDPSSQSAGAVVLVNSQSARYLDFQQSIQPYLDNFGFPYSVLDISTNAPGASLSNCAVIIVGHSQLDTNLAYLDPAAQAAISQAVSNGVGLVNFDNDLASGGAGRYQFIQDIFGFGYGTTVSGTSVVLPVTEPLSHMHYITARHATNSVVSLRSSLSLPVISSTASNTVLARAGGQPLVTITKYGNGRALQWSSYGWMRSTVLGPVSGLDDVLWRGVVWAARKPFVMRGMPNFVTMRIDDVYGPFGWLHSANAVGFKPFVALFYLLVSESSAADLRNLVTNGLATASIHSTDYGNSFFYFNHATEQPWSDTVQSNNFYLGTQWHLNHGIPISKVCATHYSEIGLNCFAGLKAWGMEFVPIEVVPQTIEYATPGAPWLVGGPFRLYETPQEGKVNWPTYYADWLTVPGHPEFDGQFFNIYSEVRDVSSCGEWCPDNDVTGSINRATAMAKRSLDSQVMTSIFAHEWYISPISSGNWSNILRGITNNLAPYQPIYVTLDYASQYVRAKRTSRIESSTLNPWTGLLNAVFSGHTDMDTQVSVFMGEDAGITNIVAVVPPFAAPITNTLASFGGRPMPPVIVSATGNVTTNSGTTVTFEVSAIGTPPLAYQWVKDGAPLADQGDVAGAATAVLTLTGVEGTNSGTYSVMITNDIGAATSENALLTIVLPPQFTAAGISSNGAPAFSLAAVSNSIYRIDVSSNLESWATLTNLPSADGVIQFSDTDFTNLPQRYYRAVWVP